MDFIKRILNYFSKEQSSYEDIFSGAEVEEKIVICYPDESGLLIFVVLDPAQWLMVCDICEISEKGMEEVVRDLVNEGTLSGVAVDPREGF
jgi:hypothetical protein